MTYDPLLDRMPTTQTRGPVARPQERPAYRQEASFKIPGGCGLMGVCDESGAALPAELAVRAMAVQRDRGNGLGGGFAGYGIYPELAELFCFHLMFHDTRAKDEVEAFLARGFDVERAEPVPTRPVAAIDDPPLLWRYFVSPCAASLEGGALTADDVVVAAVMHVNAAIDGAFVASSGRNMGAFKGVGFPEEIAHFYRLEEYAGHTWLGHSRFPTNTPGWWGGAHPFTLLDWSVVHNGEISSYGINRRYLEQFGYRCTLGTDTEVAAYLFDLLLRRHGLPLELACKVLASPLWSEIDRLGESDRGAAARPALRVRLGHAERPVRHRAGLRRRHDGPERPHQAAAAGGRPPRLDRHGGLRGERHLRGARGARRNLVAARRRARDRPRSEVRRRAPGRRRRGGLDAAEHGAARVHGRHRRPALQPLRRLRVAVRLGRLCLR